MRGRMLSLTGWMLAGLCVASGCQSTSLSRNASTNPVPAEVAWKNSASVPSSAMTQDQWTNPAKQEEPVRTTAFQEKGSPAKTEWMPPVPDLMFKDKEVPTLVVQGPPPGKHSKPHAKAPPPLPNAPNEFSPVTL